MNILRINGESTLWPGDPVAISKYRNHTWKRDCNHIYCRTIASLCKPSVYLNAEYVGGTLYRMETRRNWLEYHTREDKEANDQICTGQRPKD